MSERKRRVFPEAFKRDAGERVRVSGEPIIRLAEELGLDETGLRRWIGRSGDRRMATSPSRRPASLALRPSSADLIAGKTRLKRKLHRAEMERDIRTKATLSSTGRRNGVE